MKKLDRAGIDMNDTTGSHPSQDTPTKKLHSNE